MVAVAHADNQMIEFGRPIAACDPHRTADVRSDRLQDLLAEFPQQGNHVGRRIIRKATRVPCDFFECKVLAQLHDLNNLQQ